MQIAFRRLLLGRPLPNQHAIDTRLPKRLALAIFSSDGLSSTAYASEEILRTLMVVGASGAPALLAAWPIAIGIAFLVMVVGLSYRQTIHAYPGGASAYLVTKDNLGTTPSLVAAAALMLDYVLTVAVSVAAGIAAIVSAFPLLAPHRVGLSLVCIGLIALANLRGVRESGKFFAIPTYSFIGSMALLIGLGIARFKLQGVPPLPDHGFTVALASQDFLQHANPPQLALAAVTPFALLRAFASGCTALTGIEAISDGIPAFQKPEAKNAAKTLVAMIAVLAVLFLGISYLAHAFQLPAIRERAEGYETLISQIGRRVFVGNLMPLYYFLMVSALAILVVAANTAYQDFPRLASLLAKDRFLPRQFASQGDRLVYQNGILMLTGLAALFVSLFHAEVSSLLPLYAVGVFTSFTLSQTAMVRRWLTQRGPGWISGLTLSAAGATATAVVLVVIAVTKLNPSDAMPTGLRLGAFTLHYGSWLVLGLVPVLIVLFRRIRTHYDTVGRALQVVHVPQVRRDPTRKHTTLVLVPGLHRGIFPALEYALSLSSDARAVYVELDPTTTPTLKEEWERYIDQVPLVVLESPYRDLREPLMEYVEEVLTGCEGHQVTIILPEIDAARVTKWWHRLLHGSSSDLIRRTLSACPGVIVTSFPYFPDKELTL